MLDPESLADEEDFGLDGHQSQIDPDGDAGLEAELIAHVERLVLGREVRKVQSAQHAPLHESTALRRGAHGERQDCEQQQDEYGFSLVHR